MAGVPFKLTPEDMGTSDLVGSINNAFSKGLQNYLTSTYSPRLLENEATKGEIVNQFLPREKESSLAHQAASTQGLNLSNQYYGRSMESQLANAALNRQKMEMELNPAKKLAYIQNMMNAMQNSPMFQGAEGGGGGGMSSFDAGEPGGGQGGGGGVGMQQRGITPEMMQRFFLKEMGFDPDYQSPQAKQAAALDLYRQKQAIKNSSNMGDTATQAMLTENQRALQGIDASIPIIDDILSDKNLPGITSMSPGKNAAYNAKTSAVIDKLIAAQGLPKVQESINLVKEQIRRQSWETIDDYKARLRDLRNDLLSRRKMAQNTVESRKISTSTPNYEADRKPQGIMKGYKPGATLNLATGAWE